MYDARNAVIAEDLRFALDVLQESSIGLDSEYSAKIKAVIQKQLQRREASLNRDKAAPRTPESDAVAA